MHPTTIKVAFTTAGILLGAIFGFWIAETDEVFPKVALFITGVVLCGALGIVWFA